MGHSHKLYFFKNRSKSFFFNKLKHFLSQNILHLLYCALIVPHLHYDILLWGYANVRIYTLQKLRIITGCEYNAHIEPLFKAANT